MKMPSNNPLGINNFLYRWAKDNPPRLVFKETSLAGALAWQKKFLSELRRAIGPMPERGTLAVRRASIKDFPSYRMETLYLRASPWHEVPVVICVPHGAKKAPVVMALHGHGNGKYDPYNADGKSYHGFAAKYAEKGFIVATPEFHPFGERIQEDHFGPGFEVRCNGRFVTASLYGFTLLALNVSDVISTIDYLATRPEADISRLGCAGLSYGGTATMYTSLLDRRIKRIVLSCSFGHIAGHGLFLDELCGPQVVPGILRIGDMAEIAGCLAPRPLLLEVATADKCFPWAATKSELPRLKRIYKTLGAADKLRVDVFNEGHRWYGNNAANWFDAL